MRTLQIILFFLFLSLSTYASVDKVINVVTPGSLGALLTAEEKSSISNLIVTGTINKLDFDVIDNNLTSLISLDLSKASVVSYTDKFRTYGDDAIPYGVFSYNSILQKIILPEKLKTIEVRAFERTIISSIVIPNNVILIDEYAFAYCEKLIKLDIPESVLILGRGAFTDCSNLTDVNVKGGITTISRMVFFNCINIRSVTIPNSVTSILSGAFGNCTSVIEIHCKSMSPPISESELFSYLDKTKCVLYVPVGSISLYKSTVYWKDFPSVIEEQTALETPISTYSINVSSNHGILTIKTNEEYPFAIYSLSGRLIKDGLINGSQHFPVDNGLYFVRIANHSIKVAVK